MAAHAGPDAVETGLVLHLDAGNTKSYPGSGTTWTDLSGNGRTGTLTNGPTFSGASNGSIVFDSVDDHVSLGTFSGLGQTNRTISSWFRLISFPSATRRVISFPADDTSIDFPAYTLGISSTGVTNAGFGGSPYNGYTTIGTLGLNTWTNITSSISGNTISNYLNGRFVNSATNTAFVAASPIGYIGRYNGFYQQNLSGNVSVIQVYTRALSAAEILQNFNSLRGRYGI